MLPLTIPLSGAEPPAVHRTIALRTEGQGEPLSIATTRPRLGWQIESDRRGTMQIAYQIQVERAPTPPGSEEPLWDSGRVPTGESVHIEYGGPPLVSGVRYSWRARTWTEDGRVSDWSAPAHWEMGLLKPSDWVAAWISPDWHEEASQSNPAPMLRKTFALDGEVREARLYVTSLGLYEVELNGHRVGDAVLTPGWTSYDHRLTYLAYDVTALVRSGPNAIGATLGNGWYRGPLKWDLERNMYGDELALLAQLRIEYADGRTQVVSTDSSWKASTGPIRHSEIYLGESYDARLEKPGWSTSDYDDRDWKGVREIEHRKDILVAPISPPIRRIEEVKRVSAHSGAGGETIIDFGQNLVGWVRLKVRGPAGTKVTLRHAEVLNPDGTLYTDNLRHADQKIEYTVGGRGEETYEPHFTFQGFRYVAIEGYPGELAPDAVTAIVVHSDLPRTGHWSSSNPLLNQLQHNIVWGQKGNFVGVPTDCPQRDERLGWTGDAQVFARTATFNLDVSGFFTDWLRDLAADQKPDGAVPFVIPDVLSRGQATDSSSGWGDAATVVPWTMYLVYGDRRILETQYPSMKAWVEFIRARAVDDLWTTGWHFGDWLSYATDSPDYPGATTGKDLIATAFYAHSADLLARTAVVLEREDDARAYAALFERIKTAFNREFVTPAGRVGEATQTAYALALAFDLLPQGKRSEAARRLAKDVQDHGTHLTTGFLGTPHLCRVLSDHGQIDVAYALLQQETYPSWLYPVIQGATTIWERWDGIQPDGSLQDAGMNSFNHYAYGAIGEWMYSVVAGIDLDPAEPGYRHVLIQPRPGGDLSNARASLVTHYGEVSSAWRLTERDLELIVTIPPNTHATIRLPRAGGGARVTESGQPLAQVDGITEVATEDGDVVVQAGSGTYQFTYPRVGTR